MNSPVKRRPTKPNAVKPKKAPLYPAATREFPVLGSAAYHGVLGKMVREIEPHSEADPAAILIQALAAAGSISGRGPGFSVERTRHHCNLFVVVVGATASARKGTSLGQATQLFKEVFPDWSDRIRTGASSGEGLIWEVRNSETPEDDDLDKRLFVVESELASVLDRMGGSGNTLSPVLRQAWDGDKLDTLVKHDRGTSDNAHITLVGHITVDELRRKLTATEQANGFANRILWVYARRAQYLPRGGDIDSVDWSPIKKRLRMALSDPLDGDLDMEESAWKVWDQAYEELTTAPPGMLGAVTARAEAQVRRIATIYALLDKAKRVNISHLRAALAVWQYCFESAKLVFGHSLGDPTADAILMALRDSPDGLTRKQINDRFSRHKSADELSRSTTLLKAIGAISEERVPTPGRPATRYRVAVQPDPSDRRLRRPKRPKEKAEK